MKLIVSIYNPNKIVLKLKKGNNIIDHESLTKSQDFDTLLITAIDNLMTRNRIDRLSLKSLEIPKINELEVASSLAMVLATVKAGLRC